MTVRDGSFTGNSGGGAGAIVNNSSTSTLTVTGSTFTDNSGTAAGGIANAGTLTLANSTFFDNSGIGGGVWTRWAAEITNNTFSENTNTGLYVHAGTLTLTNTIVADTVSGTNCGGGAITDGGGNVSWPDATCPGLNQDPQLEPLADNGGPTQTMALPAGSPALDAAVLANCPETDQRGIDRPQGLGCDSGAFELEVTLCTLQSGTLTVNLPAGSTSRISRNSIDLVVTIDAQPVNCGSPTIGNVDTILVNGTIQTELVQLSLVGGRFEPGATAEGTGTSEIEVQADLGGGSDTLVVSGTSGADTFRLGAVGGNLNADDDGDDVTLAGIESVTVNGVGGNDKLSAEGGLATGSALAIPVLLNGDAGNDKLTGGTMNDVMNGGAGKDTCNALKPADGMDVCNGGLQTDTTSYAKRTGAVSLDPDGAADDGSAGENDTTATDVENLTGGKGGDTLVATATGATSPRAAAATTRSRSLTGSAATTSPTAAPALGDSCTSDFGDTEIRCEP